MDEGKIQKPLPLLPSFPPSLPPYLLHEMRGQLIGLGPALPVMDEDKSQKLLPFPPSFPPSLPPYLLHQMRR